VSRAPYLLAAGLLAAAGTAFVASAEPRSHGTGLTCGLQTSNAPGGTRTQTGTITGGPWSVQGARVSIRCTVQANGPQYPEPSVLFRVETQASGDTALLGPAPASYTPPPDPLSRLELCTVVTIYVDGGPPHTYAYDDNDDGSDGIQCPVVPPGLLPGGITVYVAPPRPDHETCVQTTASTDPQAVPPHEWCVPAVDTGVPTTPPP
jgi:hypothetical protein